MASQLVGSRAFKDRIPNLFIYVLDVNAKVQKTGLWMEDDWIWNVGLRGPVMPIKIVVSELSNLLNILQGINLNPDVKETVIW